MRLQLTVALVLITTGCTTAYLVSDPKNGPGVVKYLDEGPSAARQSARSGAYQQMQAACHSPYRIIEELPNLEDLQGQAAPPLSYIETHRYMYLHFECEAKPKK